MCYRSQKFLSHSLLCTQVGLKGEAMNLVSPDRVSSVDWIRGSLAIQSQRPLKWYKVRKIREGVLKGASQINVKDFRG